MKRTALKRKTPLRAHSSLKASAKPMRKTRSTGKPTVAQAKRFDAIRSNGCLACFINRLHEPTRKEHNFQFCQMPIEIHHVLSGGRRMGHDYTLGLCRWHHQGDKWPDITMSATVASNTFGPSFGREPRRFREIYGQELDLLFWQNQMIKGKA